MTNPRYLAVKLVDKTLNSGSYSNIQLNSGLEKSDLDSQGRKLCTAIYYGVIQRKITLDYILTKYCSRPLEKMDSIVVSILRCGIYQLLFMDSIPDNAAVNESVNLAKQFRKTSAGGMINAVLRNFIRNGKKIDCGLSGIEALSVEYSVPVPLIKSFADDYGMNTAELFFRSISESEEFTHIRRNPLKCTHEELVKALDGIEIQTDDGLCYTFRNGDVINTEAFKSGFFHVQNISSQMCCAVLNPTENDLVLDICSAPGGKAFTTAEMMNGKSEIHAFDLHEKRVKLIRDGAERLGLANIRAKTGDASVFNPDLPKYTKILCDVPCSGFGVIRNKPEIRYKNPADFAGLPEIQYKIAENALKYLGAGGEMVYSTCTVRKAENDDVVQKLLDNHPEIELMENPLTLFPFNVKGCDGFFIAKLRKKY
ncbi:MAG: 16S rRNA (cytosine(967)-C(5))-methyltransferase RsmB [Ruminococcus flavefaciens]|nr:16S rRNA (cytosine(967)-C(5))-methyltransferase RsmB [Ruminococcus flavefaciens]MCM1229022.1 16S rRNA (cytosine(967)-C(5))-methyltransferase RsmB [Ruminococcus flavefaciens]